MPEPPGALARGLVDLLIELSVGVHKFAMYPPGHPSLADIVQELTPHLHDVLAERGTLAIGVAYQQLVVGGVTTDARHPVLSDLARRLHDHQVGALSIERGITADELAGLLGTLAREPARDAPPLGTLPADRLPAWAHAKLHRVGYDHLRIRSDEGDGSELDRGRQLWLGLAQVSIAADEPLTEIPDAQGVAENIRAHPRESAYDQAVVGYLVQLTEELKSGGGAASGDLRRRVSKLIAELDEATLSGLMDFGGDVERRRRFVMDASDAFAAESVVKVLRAAASSSEQTISHSMTRLLTKLAAHTADGRHRAGAGAGSAFREHVEALMGNWSLKDPNPDEYTLSLDAMARATPLFTSREETGVSLAGAERLVSMAIEIDAWGPIVERAVDELTRTGSTRRLLELLRVAPPGNRVAERAWARTATLDELGRLFRDATVDNQSLCALAARLGDPAVDVLLDVLSDARDLSLRRRAFDVLTGLGHVRVTDRALRRLEDARWFVQRNMLALLRRLRPPLGSFDLMPWATHDHPRVRREALSLMLVQPDWVDIAIPMALEEDAEPVVRLALEKIGPDTPEAVLYLVVDHVLLDYARSDELRRVAARTLGWFGSTDSADALIKIVIAGTTLLGRPRLAEPTPPMLEALGVLVTVWQEDGVAGEVIEVARRSSDPRIRAALEAADAEVAAESPEQRR